MKQLKDISDRNKLGGNVSHRMQRTDFQVTRDRMVIADMYLRKRSIGEIANHFTDEVYGNGWVWSTNMVKSELEEIKSEWVKSTLVDFNELKAKELAEWDRLEQTYWEAWERSLQERVTDEKTSTKGDMMTKSGLIPYTNAKRKHKREDLLGDPRYLTGIERCIDNRCKILGLYSPEKFSLDWKVEAQQAGMRESEVAQEFEKMVQNFTDVIKKKSQEPG